jgi:hypothetical protein
LIDINLDSYRTPDDERPQGIDRSEFDRKAGFYIYHQLIKEGLPSDNLAFFTGESESMADFLYHCEDILLDPPKHIFEKTPVGLKHVHEWIKRKERRRTASISVLVIDNQRRASSLGLVES